jgi:Two component regulator propeller
MTHTYAHNSNTQIRHYLCILAVLFFGSCHGQNNNELSKSATSEPRVLKPQGVYKDASIGCGMQDKAGNIWFGSNGEGIYRYDGKGFTHFTTKDGLDNNIVYSILEDKVGNIWVGTKTGLNRYDPKAPIKNDGKIFSRVPIVPYGSVFNILKPVKNKVTEPVNGVWCMMQDTKGTIWFGADDGVYCYNGTYFSHFIDSNHVINKENLRLKAIFSILEDKKGHIWFGACVDEGISRFDGKFLTNIVPHEKVRRVNNIIEDKNDNLWFAASFNGVCRYDGKTFIKNVFNETKGFKATVLKGKSGDIWFDTYEGLGRYDGKKLQIITKKEGLPTHDMCPILEDQSGNLWFGSVAMGLHRYDGKSFTYFSE